LTPNGELRLGEQSRELVLDSQEVTAAARTDADDVRLSPVTSCTVVHANKHN